MSEMIHVAVDAKQVVMDWMSKHSFIQVNKKLLRQIGDTNTILLAESISQYQRWADKGKLREDGSFFWTHCDCEIETGYSRSTQGRAFKDMEKRGLLKTFNLKVLDSWNGKEKTVRFLKLDFVKIGQLMLSNDDEIINSIKEKYKDLYEKNQESKKKSKEKAKEKSMTQNESSLGITGVTQNESSGCVKMNHLDDSKWVTSKKVLVIKKDLLLKRFKEEEEEEAPALLSNPSLKLLNDLALEYGFSEEAANEIVFLVNEKKVTNLSEDVIRSSFEKVHDELNRNYIKGEITSWTAVKIEKESKMPIKKVKSNFPKQPNGSKKVQTRYGSDSNKIKSALRKEMVPDWMNEDEQEEFSDAPVKGQESSADREQFELEKKKLFDRIKKYKDSKNKEKVEA